MRAIRSVESGGLDEEEVETILGRHEKAFGDVAFFIVFEELSGSQGRGQGDRSEKKEREGSLEHE